MGSTGIEQLPELRWGIIGTGLISSWFVADLLVPRTDAKARHIVQAIGSSSVEKGHAFVTKQCPDTRAQVYGTYEEVYADPTVDIVYLGTPHAFHKKNCLDAINAGKHILCEKAFTITAKEAEEVLAAAKAKGVFIMEAMWLRFIPLVLELQKKLHKEHVIGDIRRVFCDFSMNMNIRNLGPESRLRNPALGAGSLLDIGIYSLTWGLLALEPNSGGESESPTIAGTQALFEGVDIATNILLQYPSSHKQAILSASTETKTDRVFCRIEGTTGHIKVEGIAASVPTAFTVFRPSTEPEAGEAVAFDKSEATFTFAGPSAAGGMGYYYEADAVALDIAAGRTQNAIMPHAETVRVMKMLDEVRRQGGAKFPQDDE